ncbi:MAG: YdcF family protein [Thermovirgaceae bacterium]
MDLSFFLYKLAKSALVPPGLFATIAGILSLLALRKPRKPFLGAALLGFAAVLWFLSAPVGEGILLAPLEGACRPSLPLGGNPVVMVLGGGSRYGEYPEDVEPGPYTLQRLTGAFFITQSREWPILVTGTRPTDSGYISGPRAMATTLRKLGFTGAILLEGESRTTWENFEKSAKLIDAYGFDAVVVVTNAFHMKRSLWCAEKTLKDVKIHPWPVGRLSDARSTDAFDFLPVSLHDSILALREYMGLAVYQILHGNQM